MQSLNRTSRWIFSPAIDTLAFTLPILISFVLIPLLYRYVTADEVPLWAHALTIVLTDVGHVWTTLFRTYFDWDAFQRHKVLYSAAPIVIFFISLVLHYISDAIFWTSLGYFAIYHFMKQFYGFLSLYKGRSKERFDWTFDKVVIYSGAIFPILYWHASPSRGFDWFQRDDPFIVELPELLRPLFVLLYVCVALAFVCRQAYLYTDNRFNPGKTMLVVYAWLSWGFGVLTQHKTVALCFLNLIHAFPVYFIVYFTARNKWELSSKEPIHVVDKFTRFVCNRKRWPVYLLFLFGIAIVEEFLWDVFIWQDYTVPLLNFMEWEVQLEPAAIRALSCLFALPQATHYFLDCYIWKMNESDNPGLREYVGLIQRRDSPPT